MKLLVVIPTYNERENIRSHLERVLALPLAPSVLVVDDNSPDRTWAEVEAMRDHYDERVRLLRRVNVPRGLGYAYRAGFAQALEESWDAIAQMDADGQHPIGDLVRMWDTMQREGADLVVASRYVGGGGTGEWKAGRRWVSQAGGWYARTMLRLPYADLTSGFRLWKPALLHSIDVQSTQARAFAFQLETIFRAHRRGARIVEMPYIFDLRRLGTSKMSTSIAVEGMTAVLRLAGAPASRR